MSIKNLLPNVLPLPCKSQTLAESALLNTSPSVLIPYQSLGKRPLTPLIKRNAQRQLQARPAVQPSNSKSGPNPEVRLSPHSDRGHSSSVLSSAMSTRPQSVPGSRAQTLGFVSTNATVNATRAHPFGGVSANTTINNAPKTVRKVPFREMRKFFAKTTGIHGLFTKPSSVAGRRPILPTKTGPRATGPVRNHLSDPAKTEVAKRVGYDDMPRQQPTKTSGAQGARANPVSTPVGQSASRGVNPSRLPETQFSLPPAPSSASPAAVSKDATEANQSINKKRSFGGGLMQPPPGKGSDSDATLPKANND